MFTASFKQTLGWGLQLLLGAYVVLCLIEGFAWSAELSPTYFLLVVRLVVAAVLGLVSAFMLPFTEGGAILFWGANALALALPIFLLGRLIRNARAGSAVAANPELKLEHNSGRLGFMNFVLSVAIIVTVFVAGDGRSDGAFSLAVFDLIEKSAATRYALVGIVALWLVTCYLAPAGTPPAEREKDVTDGSDAEALFEALFESVALVAARPDGSMSEAQANLAALQLRDWSGGEVTGEKVGTVVAMKFAQGREALLEHAATLAPAISEGTHPLIVRFGLSVAYFDAPPTPVQLAAAGELGAALGLPSDAVAGIAADIANEAKSA